MLRQRQTFGLPQGHLFEHFLGRSAAVIAHAGDPEGRIHTRLLPPGTLFLQHLKRITTATDRWKHQAEQLRSISSPPAEQAMGERIGCVPGQFVGAEPAHPGLVGHRGQARGKTKAVGQPGQIVIPFREGAVAVGLPLAELLPERRGADQHTIVLDPGTVDRLPPAGLTGAADGGEQLRAMPLEPVIESGSGMGETELRPALHQVKGGSEGSFSRLPRVRDRPEPGQVEMSVAQPVHHARRSGRRGQPLGHGIDSRLFEGIKLLPVIGKLTTGGEMKLQSFRQQDPIRVMVWPPGFPIQRAADQSAVVMQRTAELQLQFQRRTGAAALRKCPATGGIEQISLVNKNTIHPEPGGFSPPAQTQPNPTAIAIPPLLRPMQSLLQTQPLTTPWPDQ